LHCSSFSHKLLYGSQIYPNFEKQRQFLGLALLDSLLRKVGYADQQK
jgi:hypothetical protein